MWRMCFYFEEGFPILLRFGFIGFLAFAKFFSFALATALPFEGSYSEKELNLLLNEWI